MVWRLGEESGGEAPSHVWQLTLAVSGGLSHSLHEPPRWLICLPHNMGLASISWVREWEIDQAILPFMTCLGNLCRFSSTAFDHSGLSQSPTQVEREGKQTSLLNGECKVLEEHKNLKYCCQSASKSLTNLLLCCSVSLYPNHPNHLLIIFFKSLKKKAPRS